MHAIAPTGYVLTDRLGRECLKLDRAAAEQYCVDHHCNMDELVRRRALANDIAADPPSAMALWAWTPGPK